jgi:hypothetical protein
VVIIPEMVVLEEEVALIIMVVAGVAVTLEELVRTPLKMVDG